jgi:hypothetical protein
MQSKPALAGFALAGGTSLALRFGHRISTDLDFFTNPVFDPGELAENLEFGPDCILGMARGTLQLSAPSARALFFVLCSGCAAVLCSLFLVLGELLRSLGKAFSFTKHKAQGTCRRHTKHQAPRTRHAAQPLPPCTSPPSSPP